MDKRWKRRSLREIAKSKSPNDGYVTETSDEQEEVEEMIFKIYQRTLPAEIEDGINSGPVLKRDKHEAFLRKGMFGLSEQYESLDASRPWLCYWILHSLSLLKVKLNAVEIKSFSDLLERCQNEKEGGFGGGPSQFSHIAATYAAVNALICMNSLEALRVVKRDKLLQFLKSMRQPDGSFVMHRGGEVDVRAAYCAIVVAKLTNIYSPELFQGTAEWILRCQTYEGGFGGYPGMEAHGGYTFCGVAALVLLEADKLINIRSFLKWLCFRQMSLEGGFQGRTNKLVDSCYSFWQGACFTLISRRLFLSLDEEVADALVNENIYNPVALQEYILTCCQHPYGGFIDKPGKNRDYYHTCYSLSGLAASQHCSGVAEVYIGPDSNLLEPIHPVYNLTTEAVRTSETFFYGTDCETSIEEIAD